MTRVSCSIAVPGCFGYFHGEYDEKCRWNLSFVAAWYWAVLVTFIENTAKTWDDACHLPRYGCVLMIAWKKKHENLRWRASLVASWYRAALPDFMQNTVKTLRWGTSFVASRYWAILTNFLGNNMKKWIKSVICSIMVPNRFGELKGNTAKKKDDAR